MSEYKSHWLEDADYVYGGRHDWLLIGQDEDGDLCVPTAWKFPNGDRVWMKADRRSPLFWLRYFSSWLQKRCVWVEAATWDGVTEFGDV